MNVGNFPSELCRNKRDGTALPGHYTPVEGREDAVFLLPHWPGKEPPPYTIFAPEVHRRVHPAVWR